MTNDVLTYCVDVAKSRNFTETAKKHHLSQQALSQQIKNLEYELGIQIFERTNRSVSVTPAGEVFLKKAEIALQLIEDALHSAKAYAEGKKGYLALGYNGPSSQRYLSLILEQYQKIYPEIEVSLFTGTNQVVVDKFRRGELDLIAVGDFEVFEQELYDTLSWKGGVINAVVGNSHPFASLECVSGKQLLEETYCSLDFTKKPAMLERSMERCASILGKVPTKIRYLQNTDSIDIMVASGSGFTLLNSDLANSYKTSRLKFVPIEGCTVRHNHVFVWRKGTKYSSLMGFLRIAKEADFTKPLLNKNQ